MEDLSKIRLYIDEDVHPELAIILTKMGFDAISTLEAGNCGNTDWEQINYAIEQKRAILTFNLYGFNSSQLCCVVNRYKTMI